MRCYLVIVLAAAGLWLFRELAAPGLALSLLAVAVASFLVLLSSRGTVELGENFPELRRLPGMRWLVG